MEVAWYFRLFYMPLVVFAISGLLSMIIKSKRMTGPGPSKLWLVGGGRLCCIHRIAVVCPL